MDGVYDWEKLGRRKKKKGENWSTSLDPGRSLAERTCEEKAAPYLLMRKKAAGEPLSNQEGEIYEEQSSFEEEKL